MKRGALHQICLNFKLFNFLITKEKLERHPRIPRKSTAHNKEMKNYQIFGQIQFCEEMFIGGGANHDGAGSNAAVFN